MVNSAGWWVAGGLVGVAVWVPAARLTVETIRDYEPDRRVSDGVLAGAGVACAGLMAATFGITERHAEIPAIAGFMAAVVMLGTIDLATLKLPRSIVWVTFAWGVFTLAPIAIRDGEPGRVVRAAAGAAVAALAVWAFRFLTRGGVGLGDVRFAVPLGWFVVWRSWSELGRAGLIAVLCNGAVAVALLAVRRAGRRTKVPFGPALAVGAVAVLLGA